MVQQVQGVLVQCPSCWEEIEVFVDTSLESQEYVEDCSVCCRPMVIAVVVSCGEVVRIDCRFEDD